MYPSDLKGQSVTVIGGARSGLAVARLLARRGAKVFLTDRSAATEGIEDALRASGVAYEFGGHTARALDADLAVISPGVPSNAPLVRQLDGMKVPVVSEIEAASWFCRAPIVAITGTNGKTTTTSLAGYLLRRSSEQAGHPRRVFVAGNIGYPFADYVEDATEDDAVVLEVSSFQLDHVRGFRPRVAILLNITPDHLDRYDHSFEKYAAAKYRIFENMIAGDSVIYNADDEILSGFLPIARQRRGFDLYGFSADAEVERGAFVQGGSLVLRLNPSTEEVLMPTAELALPGRHNLYNSLASAIAARLMEVRSDIVRESLATFEGVPHRLEFVRELDGVRYVNDSKATNVNAVWYALESFGREKVVLIAGGRDKGNDYAALRPLVRDRARAVVALGESADKVMRDLGASAPLSEQAASMEDAIRRARRLARPGDVVLLSPACASFDMFENYEDRGDTFKRLVLSL
jgi:UDP-N-acetylmuramoylalanine--D-glutamate ligase